MSENTPNRRHYVGSGRLERVLGVLEGLDCRPRGNFQRGWMARCPAHEDRTPSLSVTLRDGRILVHCFAGCPTAAILDAAGLRWTDLFDDDGGRGERQSHRLVAVAPALGLRRSENLFDGF